MSRSSSRWVVGVAAVVLLGLLFYGLRTERADLQQSLPWQRKASRPHLKRHALLHLHLR